MRGLGKSIGLASVLGGLLALGPMSPAPAVGEASSTKLPAAPADGVMGFVVSTFVQPVIQEPGACPRGPSPKLREAYLLQQSSDERERLSRAENTAELDRRWMAGVSGPNGTNICSQPDMFDRPLLRTVESPNAWGLDLDDDASGARDSGDTCKHDNFVTPVGSRGVDNQEYRVMGCTLEWRGVDGVAGDQEVGLKQFHNSGEWTQVILLRGVDSLERDENVEVIYANTPDRPVIDNNGKFLPGMSFSISEKAPRNRNALKGRIANGVLTTEPKDLLLAQTWGQGGARDIRGNRSKYDLRRGRLRLTFQSDGTLTGLVGGYKPVFDVIQSPAIGGIGSALVAGIDCASVLKTLRTYADGIKDPKTGKCTGVSTAMRINAVPAFVNDVANAPRTAAR